MKQYRFKLFVAGQVGSSQLAIINLKAIGNQMLQGNYDLEIIDVLSQPARAEEEKIIVTPTLIKETPFPVQRLTGDLSMTSKVVAGLGLVPELAIDGFRRNSK